MSRDTDKKLALYFSIVGLMAGVFLADYYTRLGLAEWIFYVLPVAICIFGARPELPLFIAAGASALVFVGFVISPPAS